ncbi:MAG: glycosyltransferase, partial [Polyangiaceae bacterium]|nr:glycosyltransferase [Polyangiaceae bacterium]
MTRLFHVTTVPLSLRFLRGQVAFMKERGYEVHAVSSPGALLESFGDEEGIRVHAVPMSRRVDPTADLVALGRLVALFRRHRPEIVHAHTPKGGLLGILAARIAGVPVRIYHMRGLPVVTATGTRRIVLATTERVSCALASLTLAVSPSLRERAVALNLAPEERIRVLLGGSGNGVDARVRFRRAGGAARTRAR